MLPSTDASGLLGSFALLVERTYKEVGMQLDPEGQLMVGGRLLSFRSTGSSCNDRSTTVRIDDFSDLLQPVSCPTSWQRNAARLCQRVRDVQTLIQEDLREIDEPLTTLGSIASTLSNEHATQWEAAKTAYDRALLECSQVLDRILSPFAEPQDPLEQRVDLADSVLSPIEAVSR